MNTTDTTNPITTLFTRYGQRGASERTGIARSTMVRYAAAESLPDDVAARCRAVLEQTEADASALENERSRDASDDEKMPRLDASREHTLHVALEHARTEHGSALAAVERAAHSSRHADTLLCQASDELKTLEHNGHEPGDISADAVLHVKRIEAAKGVADERTAVALARRAELDTATTRAKATAADLADAERDYASELDALCPGALVYVAFDNGAAEQTARERVTAAETVLREADRVAAERAVQLDTARGSLDAAQSRLNHYPVESRSFSISGCSSVGV